MSLDILKVKSLTEYDKRFKMLHKHLLKPPFVGVINGTVRTGKSTILMNLIYNKNFYRQLFDKIIFISPTVQNDVTLTHLYEDEEVIKINEGLDQIDNIFKKLIETKQEDEDEKQAFYLIILDDCLGFIKPHSYVSHLCSRYRHFKISMIFTSQNFRSIPNIIRANASFYLLFNTTNKKEYNKYLEEFSGVFKDFDQLYAEATFKPYNFLCLDLRNIHAFHNFDKKLN
jgi:hypothetical protein